MPFATMDPTQVHTMLYKTKYTNGREFRYITAVAAALGYGHMTIDWYRQIKDTYHGSFVWDIIIYPNIDTEEYKLVGDTNKRTKHFIPFAKRAMISTEKLKYAINRGSSRKAWWDVIYMDDTDTQLNTIDLGSEPAWLSLISRIPINRSFFLFKYNDGETLYMQIYVGDTFADDSPIELVLNISAYFNSEDRRHSPFIDIFENMFDEEVPQDVIDYIVEDVNMA